MRLLDFFDNDAFFRSEEEIKESIKNSKNYENEDVKTAKLFLFFNTSKQRTYLVATNKRIYCILDDSRKENPHINWSMSKNSLLKENELNIDISSQDNTNNTGLVNISDKHKNWLYSKSLFPINPIENELKEFIENSMK